MLDIRILGLKKDDFNTVIPSPKILVARVPYVISDIVIIIFRVVQNSVGIVLIAPGRTKNLKMIALKFQPTLRILPRV